jgi:Arc/MetJ family transcription regulator
VSPIALYLDEHVQLALAEALRARGVDILTTQEEKNIGLHDLDQLAFAAQDRRSLFSYDKRHFARIHYEWMSRKRQHAGIILSDQLTVGLLLRRLMKLHFSLNTEDMINRLEYLSSWK